MFHFKGVLHPWQILWLFMHLSQKLQHIGDKLDMFLIGNITRNLIIARNFTNSSGYIDLWLKTWKILILAQCLL